MQNYLIKMDDSFSATDKYDEISRNISNSLGPLNNILNNGRMESKILENNLNVAEIMCSKFDDIIQKDIKTDFYDLETVNQLFKQFKVVKSEEETRKSRKQEVSSSTASLNSNSENHQSEIEGILDEIETVLNQTENCKFIDITGSKIQKKTDEIRDKFHEFVFDLDKTYKDLKLIVDSIRKVRNEENSQSIPLNKKFNDNLKKINEVGASS